MKVIKAGICKFSKMQFKDLEIGDYYMLEGMKSIFLKLDEGTSFEVDLNEIGTEEDVKDVEKIEGSLFIY